MNDKTNVLVWCWAAMSCENSFSAPCRHRFSKCVSSIGGIEHHSFKIDDLIRGFDVGGGEHFLFRLRCGDYNQTYDSNVQRYVHFHLTPFSEHLSPEWKHLHS